MATDAVAGAVIDVGTVYAGESHLEWAAGVARVVARKFRLKGQEEDDLISTAHMKLLSRVRDFDPGLVPEGGSADGQFRGWLYRSIWKVCWQEAKRLRNGGLFRPASSARASGRCVDYLPDDEHATSVLLVEDDEPPEPATPVRATAGGTCRPPAEWLSCQQCGRAALRRPGEDRECVSCGSEMVTSAARGAA